MDLFQGINNRDVATDYKTAAWFGRYSGEAANLLPGRSQDFGQSFGGCKTGKLGWLEPASLGEFLIQGYLSAEPACCERQNDKMPLDMPVLVASNNLPVASERQRFDTEAGFLEHLAYYRLNKRLAELDHAARESVETGGRRMRAPDNEYATVTKDSGADRDVGSRRIGPSFYAAGGHESHLVPVIKKARFEERESCGVSCSAQCVRDINMRKGSVRVHSLTRVGAGLILANGVFSFQPWRICKGAIGWRCLEL